jgi:hypothetical protein
VTTLAIGAWHPLQLPRAAARARHTPAWWALVLLCVSTAALGRLVYVLKVFDADGAMFVYMGKLTHEGGRLCHDLVDNKFPTVGLMTSVPWRVFGTNWVGYVVLGAVLSFTSALLLGRTARRHVGAHAVLPVTLFAIVFLNFNPAVFGGFQLETMQVFFTVLAAGAACEAVRADGDARDALVVGLACGCAAMLKPTGFAVGVAFAFALLMANRANPRRCAAHLSMLLLGVAIPALAVLAYLVAADLLADMPELARQISTYAKESTWTWLDLFKPPTVAAILGLPFLVRGWVFRRAAHRVDAPVDGPLRCFVIAWFVLEIVGVVSQRRMYAYHFLVLAPPAALLFGMIPRRAAVGALTAALVPSVLLSVHGAGSTYSYYAHTPARSPVSDYLLAHARPGDVIWQDEMMRTLIETDLRPASRLPMTFLFANHDRAPLEFGQMLLDDFARTRPRYIGLRSDLDCWVRHQADSIAELERPSPRRENYFVAWERICEYVESNYIPDARIGRETVWRRRKMVSGTISAMFYDPVCEGPLGNY